MLSKPSTATSIGSKPGLGISGEIWVKMALMARKPNGPPIRQAKTTDQKNSLLISRLTFQIFAQSHQFLREIKAVEINKVDILYNILLYYHICFAKWQKSATVLTHKLNERVCQTTIVNKK